MAPRPRKSPAAPVARRASEWLQRPLARLRALLVLAKGSSDQQRASASRMRGRGPRGTPVRRRGRAAWWGLVRQAAGRAPRRRGRRRRRRGGAGRQCSGRRDETCPVSTGGGTRRVQLVREGGAGRQCSGCCRKTRTGTRSCAPSARLGSRHAPARPLRPPARSARPRRLAAHAPAARAEALRRGAGGAASDLRPVRHALAPPPPPYCCPYRVPTVHSLPPSLAGTCTASRPRSLACREATGPAPPATAWRRPAPRPRPAAGRSRPWRLMAPLVAPRRRLSLGRGTLL